MYRIYKLITSVLPKIVATEKMFDDDVVYDGIIKGFRTIYDSGNLLEETCLWIGKSPQVRIELRDDGFLGQRALRDISGHYVNPEVSVKLEY